MTLESKRCTYFRPWSRKQLIFATMAILLLACMAGCGNGSGSLAVTGGPTAVTFCPQSSCTYNGNNGSAFGQLNIISTILVDGKDNVWIPTTTANGNISVVLIPGGNPANAVSICQTGCKYTNIGGSNPNVLGYATDPLGNLWIVSFEYTNSLNLFLLKIPASSPENPTQYNCLANCNLPSYGHVFMTVDQSQNIWVTSSIAILTKITVSGGTTFSSQQICPSTSCGGVSFSNNFTPTGIGVDSSGNVWVSGIVNNTSSPVGVIFENPIGNTSQSGVSTLCNSNQNGCTVTAPSGELGFTTTYNNPTLTSSNNSLPTSSTTTLSNNLAFDSSGNIWISDYGNSKVDEIPAGNMKNTIYCNNNCGGEPHGGGPAGIAVDSQGRAWVATTFGYSSNGTSASSTSSPYTGGGVSAYTIAGTSIKSFAGYCDFTDQNESTAMNCTQFSAFMFPQAVAVDSKGNVWVANNGFDNASSSTNNNNNGNNNGTVTGWVTELIGAAK